MYITIYNDIIYNNIIHKKYMFYIIYYILYILCIIIYIYIYMILFNTMYSCEHRYHFGFFQYDLYPKHPILRGKNKKPGNTTIITCFCLWSNSCSIKPNWNINHLQMIFQRGSPPSHPPGEPQQNDRTFPVMGPVWRWPVIYLSHTSFLCTVIREALELSHSCSPLKTWYL